MIEVLTFQHVQCHIKVASIRPSVHVERPYQVYIIAHAILVPNWHLFSIYKARWGILSTSASYKISGIFIYIYIYEEYSPVDVPPRSYKSNMKHSQPCLFQYNDTY